MINITDVGIVSYLDNIIISFEKVSKDSQYVKLLYSNDNLLIQNMHSKFIYIAALIYAYDNNKYVFEDNKSSSGEDNYSVYG